MPMTCPASSRASTTAIEIFTAAPTEVYSRRRDSGRARSTSRVPASRSPATAFAAAPTAKMATRLMPIGCWKPMVMAPPRVNRLPEPKFRKFSGKPDSISPSNRSWKVT